MIRDFRGALLLFKEEYPTQPGEAVTDAGEDRLRVAVGDPVGEEQSVCRGVPEHMGEFVALVRRVDRHEGQPSQGGGELQDDPLGAVRGPDRDPLPGCEPLQQRPRGPLGVSEQRRVRPLPVLQAPWVSVDQRGHLRGTLGGLAEDRADGRLADTGSFNSGPVGASQRQARRGDVKGLWHAHNGTATPPAR